jgi:hypothetical protein
MGLVLELFRFTLADEMVARKRFSASSTVIPHLQMVKPLPCKYDPLTFLLITSPIFAKEKYASLRRCKTGAGLALGYPHHTSYSPIASPYNQAQRCQVLMAQGSIAARKCPVQS